MLVIREEVSNNDIWDGVDDAKDTHKIGASIVRVVYGGLVVLGLSVVELGNSLGDRSLKYTCWFYFGAITDIPCIFSQFDLAF